MLIYKDNRKGILRSRLKHTNHYLSDVIVIIVNTNIKWGKGGEFRQILKKKKDFIYFQKVTLAVSKVRHLPHLPPLRYGHAMYMYCWELKIIYIIVAI